MNNVNTQIVTKSLVIISTLAVISMLTISVLPLGHSSAFDLGLISKDTNIGSIDTKSLFNCFGAAVTCDNDNTVNNNISVGSNNSSSQPNQPLTCLECFENANLTPQQEQNLLNFFASNPTSFEEVCVELVNEGVTSSGFESVLTVFVGLSETQAQALVNCLVEAGVLVET